MRLFGFPVFDQHIEGAKCVVECTFLVEQVTSLGRAWDLGIGSILDCGITLAAEGHTPGP